MLFYFGRVEGRTPGLDVEANMRPLLNEAEVPKLFSEDFPRCTDELSAHGGMLHKAGESLRAYAKQHATAVD